MSRRSRRTPVSRASAAVLGLLLALPGLGLEALGQDLPDFAEDLYPRLERRNCRACHNPSGVASETRLHFPAEDSSPVTLQEFGLRLSMLVDRDRPEHSLLLRKPTNRIPHTGGPLIEIGGEDERALLEWIRFLVSQPPPDASQEPPAARRPEPLRRLTHRQYDNTVRELLGDRTRPARGFPEEDFVNGFTNQVSAQAVTPLLAESYGRAAARLARNAFRYGDERRLVPCEPEGPSDRECAEAFVGQMLERAFRRPVSQSEIEHYVRLVVEWAASDGSFLTGAATALEAILQSPDFLYIVPQATDSSRKPYEAASRLSYALWNEPPDRQLLASARSGRLLQRSEAERQARRMLEADAAREALDGFFSQWMRFDRLLGAAKDRNRFRDYNRQVAESMAEESRRLFRHLAWNDLDFREFFTAEYTFVDDFLARIYDLPDPAVHFGRIPYPAGSVRSGILGHGTYLAQTGKPVQTSPTERGLFVREHFLCQTIPPPPPGVDASLPPLTLDGRPMTTRETMEQLHAVEEACVSCHRLVDPIGYGFEHFDTIGAFRDREPVRVEPTPQQERAGKKAEIHELPIDPSGEIAGIQDSSFRTPREAGRILANSEVCQKCIVKQLFRYLFGRHETESDAVVISSAYNRFRESGFRFRELLLALVVSDEFLQAPVGP